MKILDYTGLRNLATLKDSDHETHPQTTGLKCHKS